MKIQSSSSEFFRVLVTATDSSGSINPTGDTVDFAFISGTDEPTSSTTWSAGSWESTSSPYVARILIGGTGTVLSVGTYGAWIKITDNPEVPILACGVVTIW